MAFEGGRRTYVDQRPQRQHRRSGTGIRSVPGGFNLSRVGWRGSSSQLYLTPDTD